MKLFLKLVRINDKTLWYLSLLQVCFRRLCFSRIWHISRTCPFKGHPGDHPSPRKVHKCSEVIPHTAGTALCKVWKKLSCLIIIFLMNRPWWTKMTKHYWSIHLFPFMFLDSKYFIYFEMFYKTIVHFGAIYIVIN